MHLKIDKKFNYLIYGLIILFLTSINNYNFYNKKIFKIDQVEVKGFLKSKNTLIKDVFVEYPKDKYTDLVIIDQFDKEHTIKYKEDEKIIWNTSFSLSSLVFNTK